MRSLAKSIPNFLSLLRILFCPLLIYFFCRGYGALALAAFTLIALSDFLDGYLARRLDAVTALGQVLDPVGDKLFSLTVYSLLMAVGLCPAWYLGLILSTNLLQVSGFLVIAYASGNWLTPVNPARISKWNTALQFLWTGLLMVFATLGFSRLSTTAAWWWVQNSVFGMLALLQINVFFHYFQRFRRDLTVYLPTLIFNH